jgi:hypothetical protein
MDPAPEAPVEENVAALNAAQVSSAASRNTIPDTPAQAGELSESSFPTFAPMPRMTQQRFDEPMDDFSVRSLREEQSLSANPEASTSRASTSSEPDTSVAQPARKVERRDAPRVIGALSGQRLLATPATTPGSQQSGSSGAGIDLQTSIVLALILAVGLSVAGMFWRTVLLDRAVRRESLARRSDEESDPYNDPEFYRKLREGNFAPSS